MPKHAWFAKSWPKASWATFNSVPTARWYKEKAIGRWISKDCCVKNNLWRTADMLDVGDFLPSPLLPQARWLPQENHLETLTHNPSIWKVQSLVPEKVQNELVTRAEEGGRGGSYLKWTEFPEFSGVQELNLPHKTNKCIRGWPGMGHLEWFWQRNLCARCRVPHSNK